MSSSWAAVGDVLASNEDVTNLSGSKEGRRGYSLQRPNKLMVVWSVSASIRRMRRILARAGSVSEFWVHVLWLLVLSETLRSSSERSMSAYCLGIRLIGRARSSEGVKWLEHYDFYSQTHEPEVSKSISISISLSFCETSGPMWCCKSTRLDSGVLNLRGADPRLCSASDQQGAIGFGRSTLWCSSLCKLRTTMAAKRVTYMWMVSEWSWQVTAGSQNHGDSLFGAFPSLLSCKQARFLVGMTWCAMPAESTCVCCFFPRAICSTAQHH